MPFAFLKREIPGYNEGMPFKRCLISLGVLVVFTFITCTPASAQPGPQAIPLEDPFEIFDRFLGRDDADDQEALNRITVSIREEMQFGRQVLEPFLKQLKQQKLKVRDTGKDVEYLNRLVMQLRPHMKNSRRYRKIRILVVETDQTDARSFPGGTVVMTTGMLEFSETEAALVGVMGHELSHIDRGHQLDILKRMKLAQQSFTHPTPESLLSMSRSMTRLFARPFRPEQESEADEDAANWAFSLGYDAMELARIFKRLHDRDAHLPDFRPGFLRSHPFHIDRFNAIQQQVTALERAHPEKSHKYIGRENLKRRIPRTRRVFPE